MSIVVTAHRKKKNWVINRKGKRIIAHARKTTWTMRKKDIGYKGLGSPSGVKIIVKSNKLKSLGYSTNKSWEERKKALDKADKKYGSVTLWKMLNAEVVFRKNQKNKRAYGIFKHDRDYIMKTKMNKKERRMMTQKAVKTWKSMSHIERAKRKKGGKI